MRRSGPRRRGRASAWTEARIALVVVSVTILLIGVAYTAANVVPQTKVDDVVATDRPTVSSPPVECDGIAIQNKISGSGVIAGTIDNDWIVGSDAVDTISGLAGDDCIEGKGADDVIEGGVGNDVCIGGGGSDTFVGCETEIQ